MNEPATSEDIDKARKAILERIAQAEVQRAADHESWRQQQSAEHGALFGTMRSILESLNWLKAKWEKFTKS